MNLYFSFKQYRSRSWDTVKFWNESFIKMMDFYKLIFVLDETDGKTNKVEHKKKTPYSI